MPVLSVTKRFENLGQGQTWDRVTLASTHFVAGVVQTFLSALNLTDAIAVAPMKLSEKPMFLLQ
jgi:hypothetical protein